MSERHESVFMVTPIRLLSENPVDYLYGVVTDGDKVLVVCTEGVSWWVTDEKPWPMVYPGGKQFGISREDMITLANKSEETPIPLNKFIRSFGSRLECNFRLCENAIAENMFLGEPANSGAYGKKARTVLKVEEDCAICREMAPLQCDKHFGRI